MRANEIRSFRDLARRFHRQTGGLLPDRPCCGGVTLAQCHVLLQLQEMGEAPLQAVANALRLDKSTTSRTVNALVTRGLVRRTTSRTDGRCCALSVSPAGTRAIAAIDAHGDRNARRIFSIIPTTRRGDVVECLRLVVEACDAIDSEEGGSSSGSARPGRKEVEP
jgi:DNA-binding MarR family transcriptional regulator